MADLGTLVSAIPEGTRIVLIDGSRDGVAQMVDALRGEQGVTGIHIISHGSDGHIQLGTSSIDEGTMSSVYRSALSSIHGNLAAGADILVYGCNFGAGASGARAASMLADLTGADVATSDDFTGAADKGGDWVLEEKTGAIETIGVASMEYSGLLAPITITPVNGTTTTAMDVAQTLLGSNITVVSATLGGQNSQAGLFASATGSTPAWITFDSGVVFSSGNASSLTTTNTSDSSSTGPTTNTGGSADFTLVGGGASYNASYIDITFVPTSDRIALQFVFGSDEYNEYVYASVNDAIGMWVNGTNIAVTPAGAPIGIDTINQAATYNPRFGSQTRDPNSANGVFDSAAPSLYVNNDPRLDSGETGPGALYATSMDGFTRTLGATITVNPGVNNTIRLGIADIGDGFYDSWLLVKADSVQSNLIAQNDAVGTPINTPVTFSPLANDIDFDNDPIQITNVVDQPISVGGTVTLLSGGTVTLNADKTFTYTPPLGSTAPELFTYSTTDGNGNTATAYATVNIVAGTPPALDLDGSAAGTGYATAYTVGGTGVAIADIDSAIAGTGSITKASIGITNAFSGDQLTVNAALLPAGVTIDPSSTATNIVLVGNVSPATFADAIEQVQFSNSSGTVNAADRNIAVQVTDANGLSSNVAMSTISINNPPAFTDPDLATGPFVDPGNPANLIVPASDGTAFTVDLDLYYADPNGNTMTLVVDQSGLPSWLSYDSGTHTFSGTPPVDNTWATSSSP